MTAAQKTPPPEQRYLSTAQAAVYLGKKESAIKSAVWRGQLVPDGRGGRGRHKGHMFTRETLDKYARNEEP